MPDIFTQKKRSEVTSRIRGTGNKATELQPSREAAADRAADPGFPGARHRTRIWDSGTGDRVAAQGSRCAPKARIDPAKGGIWVLGMKTKSTRSVRVKRVAQNKPAADAGERFLAKWQGAFKIDLAALNDERIASIMAKHVR